MYSLPVLPSQIRLHSSQSTISFVVIIVLMQQMEAVIIGQIDSLFNRWFPKKTLKNRNVVLFPQGGSYRGNTVGILWCVTSIFLETGGQGWGGRLPSRSASQSRREMMRNREGEREREPVYTRRREEGAGREGKWWREWCASMKVSAPSCAPLWAPISLPETSSALNPLTFRPLFICSMAHYFGFLTSKSYTCRHIR